MIQKHKQAKKHQKGEQQQDLSSTLYRCDKRKANVSRTILYYRAQYNKNRQRKRESTKAVEVAHEPMEFFMCDVRYIFRYFPSFDFDFSTFVMAN